MLRHDCFPVKPSKTIHQGLRYSWTFRKPSLSVLGTGKQLEGYTHTVSDVVSGVNKILRDGAASHRVQLSTP